MQASSGSKSKPMSERGYELQDTKNHGSSVSTEALQSQSQFQKGGWRRSGRKPQKGGKQVDVPKFFSDSPKLSQTASVSESQPSASSVWGPQHAAESRSRTNPTVASQRLASVDQQETLSSLLDGKTILMATLRNLLQEAEQADGEVTDGQRESLFQALRGHVKELAFDGPGCRLVQRVLDFTHEKQSLELVQELHGHVVVAVESLHANHVVQKCIEIMRPSAVHFILTELHAAFDSSKLACHQYGCRVLERIIEHFPPSAMLVFLEDIIKHAKDLCFDHFGNFVIQHVLEHGSDEQKRRIVDALLENLQHVALDPHGCSVLDKAISYTRFQKQLASAILAKDGLLPEMAAQRGGVTATQRLFMILSGSELENAKAQLSVRPWLLQSKHGKAVLQTVTPDLLDGSEPQSVTPGTNKHPKGCAAQQGSGRQPQRKRRGHGTARGRSDR